VKAQLEQEAAENRDRVTRATTAKIRKLTDGATRGQGELDEAAMEALASKIAGLVSPWEAAALLATVRELLPPYVARHIQERPAGRGSPPASQGR
jgi:hypothetical protein